MLILLWFSDKWEITNVQGGKVIFIDRQEKKNGQIDGSMIKSKKFQMEFIKKNLEIKLLI